MSLGNYWDDFSGTGTYPIAGSAGSVDNYPFVWDVTDPTIDIPLDIEYFEGESGITLSWNPTDAHPDSYIIYRNSTEIKSGLWNSTSEYITINVDGLSVGIYNYTLVVTDVGGNYATDTAFAIVSEHTSTTTTTTTTTTNTISTTTTTTTETGDITMTLLIGGGIVGLVIIIIVISRMRNK